MQDFKKLNIWNDSMILVKSIYEIIALLPENERFGLRNQMSRAAVSIPSNIAEGSSRKSQKDFRRFLEIALGSAFELETQILILMQIQIVQTKEKECMVILDLLTKIQKQINSLIQKLKN
jgi:four helix bundle protein